MLIRKLDLDEFEAMGDCRWQMLYPWEGVAENTPFYSGWTHLAPGQKTKQHQHHETETYFVAYGHGVMRVEGEDVPVGPGDVIYMPPFNDHILENTHESDDLLFLSVFWEDLESVPESKKASEERERSRRSLILAMPPSGDVAPLVRRATRLPAEALARYLEMRGVETTLPDASGSSGDLPARVQDLVDRLVEAGHAKPLEPESGDVLTLSLSPWIEPLKRYFARTRMSPRLRAVGERALHRETDVELRVSRSDLAALGALLDGDAGERVVFVSPGQAELALALPVLWLADGRDDRLPTVWIDHEPLTAELSLPGDEEADTLRLYLARAWPETEPATLDEDGLGRAAGELGTWNEWLAALSRRLQDEYDGVVPATGLWTEEQHQFHRRLLGRVTELGRAYEPRELSLPRVVRILSDVVWDARRFARREEHWIGVPDRKDERRTSLALELTAAKVLALGATPLLPHFSEHLRKNLGYDEPLGWEEVPEWVPAGRELAPFDVAVGT